MAQAKSFPPSPSSSPSARMGPCFLYDFYQFDFILAVICKGLRELRVRNALFYMDVIVLFVIHCVLYGFIGLLVFDCVL